MWTTYGFVACMHHLPGIYFQLSSANPQRMKTSTAQALAYCTAPVRQLASLISIEIRKLVGTTFQRFQPPNTAHGNQVTCSKTTIPFGLRRRIDSYSVRKKDISSHRTVTSCEVVLRQPVLVLSAYFLRGVRRCARIYIDHKGRTTAARCIHS